MFIVRSRREIVSLKCTLKLDFLFTYYYVMHLGPRIDLFATGRFSWMLITYVLCRIMLIAIAAWYSRVWSAYQVVGPPGDSIKGVNVSRHDSYVLAIYRRYMMAWSRRRRAGFTRASLLCISRESSHRIAYPRSI